MNNVQRRCVTKMTGHAGIVKSLLHVKASSTTVWSGDTDGNTINSMQIYHIHILFYHPLHRYISLI